MTRGVWRLLSSKDEVGQFWEAAACGEKLLLADQGQDGFRHQAEERFRLEPFIVPFAAFSRWGGAQVLEIGLGLGADHERFAAAGAHMTGVDLTRRAVAATQRRLALRGLRSRLLVGDAERLPFAGASFDLVYSWGVIHHSPDTQAAVGEILRVLRPGGAFRVMIYHTWSLVGFMLWLRYALFRGRPCTPLSEIYAAFLESPGTKAYSVGQARELFAQATDLGIAIELTHGDLLSSGAGQRHQGRALDLARRVWPRWLLQRVARRFGLFMLISGRKPMGAVPVVEAEHCCGKLQAS